LTWNRRGLPMPEKATDSDSIAGGGLATRLSLVSRYGI
jgi:hypothetical protein